VGIRQLLWCTLLAIAYLGAARFGLALDAVGGFAAPVWPPTGLALASLLVGGVRLWPGVLVGAVAANFWAGAPAAAALAIGVGNTLESVVAVSALRRAGFQNELERVRDVAFLTAAALTSPLLSAGIGVLSLYLAGVVPPPQAGLALGAWWVGDVLGALVVAPLLLTFTRARVPAPAWTASQRSEAFLVLAFTALSTWFVFAGRQQGSLGFQEPFLVFPALVWAALRLGQRVAVRATFLVSAAAIAATIFQRGPFAGGALHEGLLALQIFMGVVSVGVLLVGAAMAERRRIQDSLRQAIELRDEFLSIAGHELRTPLAALILDLGSLQRRMQKAATTPTTNGALEALNGTSLRAVRHAERLSQLVDRLLEASQIQQGRRRLEPRPLDLRVAVGEVVERFAEQADRAGCRIAIETAEPVTGLWDALGIEQVASNLIVNAIKYAAGKPIEVSVQARGKDAVLTVRDQGIGLAADEVDRIFDRFARAAPTRNFGGLGLGLYITRQIVEAHGGSITVASQPGAGASFIVALPRSPPPAGEAAGRSVRSPASA
jgi:signal transduction histidine kinase